MKNIFTKFAERFPFLALFSVTGLPFGLVFTAAGIIEWYLKHR